MLDFAPSILYSGIRHLKIGIDAFGLPCLLFCLDRCSARFISRLFLVPLLCVGTLAKVATQSVATSKSSKWRHECRPTKNMIEVNSLTKNYGARRAINAISFSAKRGEIVGFLGPNGAGKTTTMRILTGYMPPSSGSARVAGFDVVDNSLEVRRRVGYLPENVPLYNEMTVLAYLKFMADLRQLDNVQARIADVLAKVGMTERAQGTIARLSKGMRQRIGLAQALIHEPDVLILDEPTIGLDPAQVVDVRNLIAEIGRERTVLLSTHILSEAQQLCDRVLIINKGKIVAEGTPSALGLDLTGAERVEIRLKKGAALLAEQLTEIDGLQAVRIHDESRLEFTFDPSLDVRPQVAQLIVASRLELLEMKSIDMSLEEIFLQLTQEGGDA